MCSRSDLIATCPSRLGLHRSFLGTVTVKPTWLDDEDEGSNSIALNNSDQESTFLRSGRLQVFISDTGVGMSQDQINRLFKAGVQYNSNKLQAGQGSGLGLFIARGIMKQHNGDLTVASDGFGHGSTFVVEVPVYEMSKECDLQVVSDGDTDMDATTVDAGPSTPNDFCPKKVCQAKHRLRVLVVDDSLTNRKLLVRLLEKKGHYCDQAEDGLVALNKVTLSLKPNNNAEGGQQQQHEQQLYDSILIDYEMPNMDGPTAVQKMRQLPGFGSKQQCHIVGITGNALPEDVAYFKKCGADNVLPKPLDIPLLTKEWKDAGLLFVKKSSTDEGLHDT